MDFAPMLKQVIDFIIVFLGKEFTFAGYTVTVGAFLIWCAVAGLIISILKGLAE